MPVYPEPRAPHGPRLCGCGDLLTLTWDPRHGTWGYAGADGRAWAENPARRQWHDEVVDVRRRYMAGEPVADSLVDWALEQWAHAGPGSGMIAGPLPVHHSHFPADGTRWWELGRYRVPPLPTPPECCDQPMRWRVDRALPRWECRVDHRTPS